MQNNPYFKMQFFTQSITIKHLRHPKRISAFPFWIKKKASYNKVYKFTEQLSFKLQINRLKDPFYYVV